MSGKDLAKNKPAPKAPDVSRALIPEVKKKAPTQKKVVGPIRFNQSTLNRKKATPRLKPQSVGM